MRPFTCSQRLFAHFTGGLHTEITSNSSSSVAINSVGAVLAFSESPDDQSDFPAPDGVVFTPGLQQCQFNIAKLRVLSPAN